MGIPVIIVPSGGLPVAVSTSGYGLPMTVSTSGYGLAVTQAPAGGGLAVVGITFGPAVPAAPVLTLTSSTSDNTPDFTLTGDLVLGDTVRFQYSTSAVFSGASELTNTIDAGEDAANSINFTTGALANNTWYFRARIERPVAGNSNWSNVETETIAAGAYTGPGDIVSGAVSWYGLRAYSAARATALGPCIDIVKASDGTAQQTINLLSDGTINVAAIAALGYAVVVKKWYDQTTNGNDLTQATLANMPALTLSAIGSRPTVTFIGNKVMTKALFTQAQPATVTTFARLINSNGNVQGIVNAAPYTLNADNGQPAGTPSSWQMVGSAGQLGRNLTPLNTWYAVGAVFNNLSSDFQFDGVSQATGATGTGAPANQTLTVGNTVANINVCEIGAWNAALTGTQLANISSNQHTYWGI